MAKKEQHDTNSDDSFEMIELAIDDLSTLTRAFNLIAEICKAEAEDNSGTVENSTLIEELPATPLVH